MSKKSLSFLLEKMPSAIVQRYQNRFHLITPEIESAVNTLVGTQPHVLLIHALCKGDYRLADLVWHRYGQFKIQVDKDALGSFISSSRYGVVSIPYHGKNRDESFKMIADPETLCHHIKLIQACGAGGLIGYQSDCNWLKKNYPGDQVASPAYGEDKHADFLSANLPIVRSGHLWRPEVAIVLANRTAEFGAIWFENMLCWATPEMVASNQDYLLPFGIAQTAVFAEADGKNQEMDVDQLDLKLLSRLEFEKEKHRESCLSAHLLRTLGVDEASGLLKRFEFDVHAVGRDLLAGDKRVLAEQCNKLIRYGMAPEQKEGLVLCRTTLSYLMTLPKDSVSPAALTEAGKQLSTFLPLGSGILLGADSLQVASLFTDPVVERVGIQYLVQELSKTPTALKTFTTWANPALVRRLLDLQHESIRSIRVAEVLEGELGESMVGSTLGVSIPHIKRAGEHGARIPAGMKVSVIPPSPTTDYTNHEHYFELIRLAKGPIDLFGYPSDMPVSVVVDLLLANFREETLTRHQELALKGMVRFAGQESLVKLMKHPDDWELMRQVFGIESLIPHIAKTSDRLQTIAASEVMGF
ncbi:hypothetical protein HNP46_006378 [Pseudomonas nitritireducens]|uniref:Uncharacterized protein n=1 Tax=Pseudomonas nitroreducens TaxID=46680 RepID=A0A7W7KRX9_PSENT|nr:hypothetical protein [Pseudomonas nitritireducens]MBB4867465.1 hypothetical protein [Pseudomonas nitritireducens]